MPTRRPWAFARGMLWALDLAGEAPAPVAPRVMATFEEVYAHAAGPLTAAMGLPDAAPVLRRFTAGSRCFVARVGEGIAAYAWVSYGREHIGEFERDFHVPAGEAYIWNCVTLPAFRRQHLYRGLLGHVLLRLGEQGIRRAWICAVLPNAPSLRGIAAAGFRPVAALRYERLLNRAQLWVRGHPSAPLALIEVARRHLAPQRSTATHIVR